MSGLTVLSTTEHASKRWIRPADFRFASKDRMVTLAFSELPKAMMSLPLAFVKNGNDYLLVAMMGFLPNQNLVIAPNGQWLAEYVPLMYRTLPFRLAKNTDGEFVVCVDHGSGLVSDGPLGFKFFEEGNSLGAEAKQTADLLAEFEADRQRMLLISQALEKHNVMEEWKLQVQMGSETKVIDGLYRISEAKLMQVSAEGLAELRNCGGLMLCYGQLLSIQHINKLGKASQYMDWVSKLAEMNNKVAPLNIVDDNGIVSFANL